MALPVIRSTNSLAISLCRAWRSPCRSRSSFFDMLSCADSIAENRTALLAVHFNSLGEELPLRLLFELRALFCAIDSHQGHRPLVRMRIVLEEKYEAKMR